MQSFWLDLQNCRVRGQQTFTVSGRAVGATGKPRKLTDLTHKRMLACLRAIGICPTDRQHGELTAGQLVVFATDERALRALSLWE